MLLYIIRFLRGYVDFRIIGKFPERFINLCARRGIRLFSPVSTDDGFFASMFLRDYKNIRRIAFKSSVRLRTVSRHGLPFIIYKYRARKGILAGAVLFILITLLLRSFIWTVEINGVETVSYSAVYEEIYRGGLHLGTYKDTLDVYALERKLMEEIDEIGWMSINVLGTKAQIEIKEKEQKPDTVESLTPCNIVAASDGIIKEINTKSGKAHIVKGSAVIEGQLLISGAVEDSLGGIRYVCADGEVFAETTRALTFSADKSSQYKSYTEVFKRHNLLFLWFEFPLTAKNISAEYSSVTTTQMIRLNDTVIPLGVHTEHCTLYQEENFTLTPDSAKNRLSVDESLWRLFSLQNCSEITTEYNFTDTEGKYILDVNYTCTEDIAKRENIIVN